MSIVKKTLKIKPSSFTKEAERISGRLYGDSNLKPQTKDKHVGVELEIVCPTNAHNYESPLAKSSLAYKLAEAGLVNNVRITTDSSINIENYDTNRGLELRVIAPEKDIKEVIVKVCSVLKGLKCKVNSSCGLHVHLDMRSRKPEDSFKRLVNKLPELKKMVRKSRLKNDYCVENYCDDLKLIQDREDNYYGGYDIEDDLDTNDDEFIDNKKYKNDVEKKLAGVLEKVKKNLEFKLKVRERDLDRYLAINPHSLENHKTIEVRLHEGCIEEEKINKWIETLVDIADGKVA